MTQCRFDQQTGPDLSRRSLIKGVAAMTGVATIGTRFALAQSTQTAATPPSTVTIRPGISVLVHHRLPIPIRTFSRFTPFSTNTA